MRPGRLPEDHPLEQQARDELREKQGVKPEAKTEQDTGRWAAEPTPRRWGTRADVATLRETA